MKSECLKHESPKVEQREQELVVFEKSEEVNFFVNQINSYLVIDFSCVQNFGELLRKVLNPILNEWFKHKGSFI